MKKDHYPNQTTRQIQDDILMIQLFDKYTGTNNRKRAKKNRTIEIIIGSGVAVVAVVSLICHIISK